MYIYISIYLFLFFPQHLCSGSPFLPSLSALGRIAGIAVPPPPRATRTALLLLLLLLFVVPSLFLFLQKKAPAALIGHQKHVF